MLLQYVVFPADDQLNCVTTELWVEPQHGYILGTPPTLHYLEELQHTQISDKVCEKGVWSMRGTEGVWSQKV